MYLSFLRWYASLVKLYWWGIVIYGGFLEAWYLGNGQIVFSTLLNA